jgi:hypothetical protein
MTKSCASHKGQGCDLGRGAALALQGKGVENALIWGVLDRSLEPWPRIELICGALNRAPIETRPTHSLIREDLQGPLRRHAKPPQSRWYDFPRIAFSPHVRYHRIVDDTAMASRIACKDPAQLCRLSLRQPRRQSCR